MVNVIEDPDTDKIPNLVVQLRKSIDLSGEKPILFKDGSKFIVPVNTMHRFLDLYASLKPIDREEVQRIALKSKDDFVAMLLQCDRPKAPKSIYNK